LLVQRLKSALSDRRGNNGRQLEVVSHAPPITSIARHFPLSRFDRHRFGWSFSETYVKEPNFQRKRWFPRIACFCRNETNAPSRSLYRWR
jgi:hypothetical protein